MKKLKRILSIVMTLIMIVCMFPIYSSANNVIETAIAWATRIANDNTHGYSQTNRYGPDYDCSSLVTTAFRNAGIDVPYDCNTRNMKDRFVNAGFVWIPASSIPNFPSSSANLQRGDILLKSGHTELYIGNNQNIGAHDDYNGISGGIGGGKKWSSAYNAYRYGPDEIDVCKYWNGNWTGVLRYNGGQVTPSNVWVSLPNGPESSYKRNETFHINFGAEWADTYHVYIWRQHESESAFYYETYISAQSDGNGYCSVVFADIGHFSCVITASNALGSAQSEWIGWDIVDSAPYELSIITEKENYTTDEAVNFTLDAKYATYKHIGIHKIEGNKTFLYRESDVNGSTISLSDFEPGLYRANFDAINAAGRTRSDWAYFSVCDSLTHCNEKIIDDKFLKSEAMCVTKAIYYQSCSVCGAVGDIVFEYGAELGHSYNAITTPPTCTEKGYTTYTCACGERYNDNFFDAKGHAPEVIPGKPATETETGLTDGEKCSVCGSVTVEQTVIPVLAHKHDYTSIVTTSTCTEKGFKIYTCTCGDTYVDNYVDATGHTPGKWSVVTESQVGIEGKEQQKCTECGEILDERSIPALPEETYISGDANGDGKVNAADARIILRISAQLEKVDKYTQPFEAFDVNGDGKINASDARKVLRISAKLES